MDGAESVELFQEDVFEAGLFFEFATGGLFHGFFDTDKTAGERPAAFERLQTALDEKNLEFPSSRPKTTQSTVRAGRAYW